LLDAAENFPLGARAYVFCDALVFAAQSMDLTEDDFLGTANREIGSIDATYEDITTFEPPPPHTIELFKTIVRRLLVSFEYTPSYETLSVLSSCISKTVRQGVPKQLVLAMLEAGWKGVPLTTGIVRGDKPSRRDLNGVSRRREN
jgi:hypothetical protein